MCVGDLGMCHRLYKGYVKHSSGAAILRILGVAKVIWGL